MPFNHFQKLSRHLWMIHGEDESRFPSGNALFLNLNSHKILMDTNPGEAIISEFLRSQLSLETEDITDIILSHAHLDHGRGLAAIFEKSNALIHAHEDTLCRCEKKARIGLYAGISEEEIHHFKSFGESLEFKDKNYPDSNKRVILDNQTLRFEGISIKTNETNAHCLHMFDFEIIGDNLRYILSCDYDFTPVPWYGVPQRGESVQSFKNATEKLISKNVDYIISSHLLTPISRQYQWDKLQQYKEIIDHRTIRAINLIPKDRIISLRDVKDFVYPINRMQKRYSEDYIKCAQAWDNWLLLAHLEEAWRLKKVKCVDSGGDKFLEKCIEKNQYLPEIVDELLIKKWASETLKEKVPFSLPLDSKWIKN